MASKGELYHQINVYQMRIEECRKEIDDERKKIEELHELSQKLEDINLNFITAKNGCKQRLYNMTSLFNSLKRISSKIISSYERNMSDLLDGEEYQRVIDGLDASHWVVREEINKRERRIDDLQSEIRNLEKRIGGCRSEIANIERREREERERREREEREAREARERAALAGSQSEGGY